MDRSLRDIVLSSFYDFDRRWSQHAKRPCIWLCPFVAPVLTNRARTMAHLFDQAIAALKEKLVTMASHAESAVNRSIKALIDHDDAIAARAKEDDRVIDCFEIEIDDMALKLLAQAPLASDLRLITIAMKISHDLERVGDEATTICRRALELNQEPQLKPYVDIPHMAGIALQML